MPAPTPSQGPNELVSNQHQNHFSKPTDTYPAKSKGIICLAPKCDRLTLSGPLCISDVFKSATSQGEDPATYLQRLALEARMTLGETIKKGADPDLAFKFVAKRAGYVGGHKALGPNAALTGFYVATKPNKKGEYSVRIELNPCRLGPEGLLGVDTVFSLLFSEELNFNRWLARALFTRIDVAIDVVNVDVTDLIFHDVAERKWSSFHGPAFDTQTVSLLKPTKMGRWRPEIRVYNKAEELKSKGQPALHGPLPHTRIEASRETRRRFRDLPALPNPLGDFCLGYMPEAANGMPPGFKNFVHGSMRVGMETALSDVLPDQRSLFANARQNASASFWQPEETWSRWSEGIQQCGLSKWIAAASAFEC